MAGIAATRHHSITACGLSRHSRHQGRSGRRGGEIGCHGAKVDGSGCLLLQLVHLLFGLQPLLVLTSQLLLALGQGPRLRFRLVAATFAPDLGPGIAAQVTQQGLPLGKALELVAGFDLGLRAEPRGHVLLVEPFAVFQLVALQPAVIEGLRAGLGARRSLAVGRNRKDLKIPA